MASPSLRPSRNRQVTVEGIRGLRNTGNTCFLNSVVQTLASLDDFGDYLEHLDRCTGHKRGTVIAHLRRTIAQIHSPSRMAVVPEISYHPKVCDKFLRSGEQQDASEFLVHLFDWLEKDLVKYLERRRVDLPEALFKPAPSSPIASSLTFSSSFVMKKRLPRSTSTPSPSTPRSPSHSPFTLSPSPASSPATPDHGFASPSANDGSPSPTSSASASTSTSLANSQHFSENDLLRIPPPLTEEESLSQSAGFITPSRQNFYRQNQVNGSKRSIFTVNPFSGLLESTVHCQSCNYHSTTYSEFLEITVPIVHHGRLVKSIQESLRLYTTPDSVDWGCDECRRKAAEIKGIREEEVKKDFYLRNAEKLMTIARAPKLLYLHLHRLIQFNGRLTKVDHHVAFGSTLAVDDYLSSAKGSFAQPNINRMSNGLRMSSRSVGGGAGSGGRYLYDLVAVIVHLGGAGGGHYVAYRKRRENEFAEGESRAKSWVYLSDESWEYVEEKEVLAQQAFMLYYVRRSAKTNANNGAATNGPSESW